MPEDVVVVHTSDLHLGWNVHGADGTGPESVDPLRQVLAAAQRAHVLVVAGDLFDHNRLPLPLLEAAGGLLAEAGFRIVILPGNHDPLTADSVYYRGPFAKVPNVFVLGLAGGESVIFPECDLEVWGRAHRSYGDMAPLAEPPHRTTRWRVAVAHGHYDDAGPDGFGWRPSWRIRPDDLAAAQADYIALGHANRAARVGDGAALAYYSGCPDLAGTVNVVQFASDGDVHVTREPLSAAR